MVGYREIVGLINATLFEDSQGDLPAVSAPVCSSAAGQGNESEGSTTRRFDSRGDATDVPRPMLVVSFAPRDVPVKSTG